MDLTACNISKKFNRRVGGANWFYAVQPTDFTLKSGKLAVIYGRSGSGKTTFLNLIGGLLQPSEGRVLLGDTDLYAMTDKELSAFRNKNIGMIPQGSTALGSLTVLENILLPAMIYGKISAEEENYAKELLDSVGITLLSNAMPQELSGGEQRRMAIARSLINRPVVLLCDEPTGDLDDENTRSVLELLRGVADKGTAVLMVTHEPEAKNYADIVIKMDSGTLKCV